MKLTRFCCLGLALLLCSCAEQSQVNALAPDNSVKIAAIEAREIDDDFSSAAIDFSIDLFSRSFDSKNNTLVSPLSVMMALATTANGADNNTLKQMETVLGGELIIDKLNEYLHGYIENLPDSEKVKLSIANSVWMRDHKLVVEDIFIKKAADYYNAEIFKAKFDNETLKDMNDWIAKNTDNGIKDAISNIPDYAMLYIINTVLFDAEWASPYYDYEVRNGTFTDYLGNEKETSFMYSGEWEYIEDENSTGFLKQYSGGKYSFAAILPNEDISVEKYVKSLDGEKFAALIGSNRRVMVTTVMPKFEFDYSIEMSEILTDMGMVDAFSSGATDFTKMGRTDNGLYIDKVSHQTFIKVDEKGTKAGAATVVMMGDGAAMIDEVKEVILDRPFVFAIMDNDAGLPIFIGTVLLV